MGNKQINQQQQVQEQVIYMQKEAVKKNAWIVAFDEKKKKVIIPLKHISYSVNIYHSVARVCIEMNYQNPTDSVINVNFYFAISTNACFDGFEAEIGNRQIKAAIKQKEEAKQEYQKGIQQGKMMAYSENIEDIMVMKLGNLPQKENIKLRFYYIEQLYIINNKFELILPFSLTPRYDISNQKHLANYDKIGEIEKQISYLDPLDPKCYTWNIDIQIFSPNNKIISVYSPSHALIEQNKQEFEAKLALKDLNSKANKNFVLDIQYQSFLTTIISKNNVDHEQSPYCCMINYIPQAQKNKKIDNDKEIVLSKCQGEFIFLIDRSGSMMGERINMAKQSLIIFLKSMPIKSYFNIISFGSQFSCYKNQSLRATEINIQNAIQFVEQMDANMGGTEILKPLQVLYETQKIIDGYPRFIYLITDGGVLYTELVIKLIKENVNYGYVYSLGIGNGVNQSLVKGCAEAGKGQYQLISDNKMINEKVIALLKASLSYEYADFQIEFNKKNMNFMVPKPESIGIVNEVTPFNCFMFFNKEVEKEENSVIQVNISFKFNGKLIKDQIEINFKNHVYIQQGILHKLGIHKAISKMQDNVKRGGDILDDIEFQYVEDIKQQILNYSLKYQVLSQATAFVMEIKELSDNNKEEIKQNKPQDIVVPIIQSVDYMQSSIDLTEQQQEQQRFSQLGVSAGSGSYYGQKIYLSCNVEQSKGQAGCCGGGGGSGRSYTPPPLQEYDYQQNYKNIQEQHQIQNNYQKKKSNQQHYNETNKISSFIDIIKLQKLQGCWELNKELYEFLGFDTQESFLQNKPSDIQDDTLWMTILIIVLFEFKYSQDKGSWELVILKARQWVQLQKYDIQKSESIAKKCLKL